MDSVLITGSSRGIGKAIALNLAAKGYEVIIHCRSQREQADKIADTINLNDTTKGTARVLQFDINDRETTKQILEEDIKQHGCYYGAICNAGIARDAAFPAISDEDWDSVIHTNLDGFYNVLHPIIMPMIQCRKPRRIITLSSVSGIMGNRGQVNYSAAKAGIIGATKALAIELAKRKITVNCIAPGLIDTDMIEEHVKKEAMKIIPMQRMGKPEEVAALAAFLLSEDAGYITRQVISVNGGML